MQTVDTPTVPAIAGARPRPERHAAQATTPPWKLLLRFTLGFKTEYLLRMPSNQAWRILVRKYDAFTTDRAYDLRPSSWLGPLGWWADRRVLAYPVHAALRDRLRLVTEALACEAESRLCATGGPVRLLTAPCGLCRDVIGAAARVRERQPLAAGRFTIDALDIDANRDVIPEARRRMQLAGVEATFHREDLFDPAGLAARTRLGRRFDIVSCIGLTAWLHLDEVERLVRFFRTDVMRPGATLLLDNFARHDHSDMGDDLEIYTRYHDPEAFRRVLEAGGFTVRSTRSSANGVVTLWTADAR